MAHSAIPVFRLYGEGAPWPTLDLLHCESIHSRSSLYGWTIRVHQHADIVQLLYLHRGEARLEVEGIERHIREASLVVVPALCAHGYTFAPGTEGWVLSLAAPLVSQFEQQFGQPLAMLGNAACLGVGEAAVRIATLFETLHHEYRTDNAARDMMIHSLLGALLAWLSRQQASVTQADSRSERRRMTLQRFTQLVENHFREHRAVAWYARALGMSSAHLNTLCNAFHGCSALGVVHRRLLLEARRSLLYTSMTIAQIAEEMGFSDATYFSRFFRRASGCPPSAFRQAGGKMVHPAPAGE